MFFFVRFLRVIVRLGILEVGGFFFFWGFCIVSFGVRFFIRYRNVWMLSDLGWEIG